MKNPYDIDQAQQHKQKQKTQENSSSLQEEVDQEIKKEAERVEAVNHKKAKEARMKLEKSAQTQKGTTDEMRRQGEKITSAKKSALKVHSNADEANKLADNIEKESHMFNFGVPFLGRIKKWWARDKNEEREIEKIGNEDKDEGNDKEESGYESEEYKDVENEGSEYIAGQHKTDAELYKILHSVKKINKEAESQSKLAKKQTVDLQDINKVNEYSKKKVDKADENLKKGL